MKQNKQKALERLREIEKEYNNRKRILTKLFNNLKKCGNLRIKKVLDEYNREETIRDDTIINLIEIYICEEFEELKKEAQKIKDDWEDGCGKFLGEKEIGTSIGDINQSFFCGKVLEIDDMILIEICPTCKAQNKEKEEICGRILG